MTPADVVVLLGPPGSGKSTIGAALGEHGLRWRDWEAHLLSRWADREAFLAAKATALPAHHAEIRAWIDDGAPAAAVLETTGLSDAPLLDELGDRCFIVRLVVDEHDALERVRTRAQGRHLADDVALNQRVWQAASSVDRRADLVVDTGTTTVADAVDRILRRYGSMRYTPPASEST